MPNDVVELRLSVYPDGGLALTVPPGLDERLGDVLAAAGEYLSSLAASEKAAHEPVVCPVCGAVVASVRAAPDTPATLRPCGHTAT